MDISSHSLGFSTPQPGYMGYGGAEGGVLHPPPPHPVQHQISSGQGSQSSSRRVAFTDPDDPREVILSLDDLKVDQKIHVPISLSLILLTAYVSGGGFLFSIWEEDWSFLEGSYFCFISLSTIGFGDLVPGSTVISVEGGSQKRMVICSLYLLAGLALIAMCFNLMQEEVVHKIRSCGKRIGIITDPEDEDDDDATDGFDGPIPG